MKSRRWLLVVGLLVVGFAVAAAACAGSEEPGAPGDGVTSTASVAEVPRSVLECPQGPPSADTPLYGGTLTIIANDAPANLGAWWDTVGFADKQLSRFAVENLVGLNDRAQPVPQLATSWEVDDVGMTITFHLREGVKFHDGTDFNAEAVKWNLDMQKNGPKAELKDVTAIEVVDPYTVRLALSQMDPLFVQKLSSLTLGKMTSPAAYELYGPEEIKLHPVGTGPFKFDSYAPDVVLKFTKFEDYWQEGLPYLDGVNIQLIADATTALMAFKRGEGQVLRHMTVDSADELVAEGNTVEARLMAMWSLAGDSDNPDSPASDIRVRRALAYAIDSQMITAAVWDGYCPATNQLAVEGVSAYNPAIKGYAYDPVKAKALLAEVGITPETPWKTTLRYITDPDRTDFFTVVQEQLAAVGIEVTLEPISYAAMNQLNAEGWDGLVGFNFPYNMEMPYSSVLQQFLCKDAYMKGSLWIPDEFDAAYRAMLTESDMAKREAAYQELNRMAVDDFCIVAPLFGLTGVIALSPDIHDSGFCVKCSAEFLPERAWLSGGSTTEPGASGAGAATTGTSTD